MSEDVQDGTRSRSVSLSAGSPPGQDSSTTRTRSISPLPPKPPPQDSSKQSKPAPALPDKPEPQALPTVAVSSPPNDTTKDQTSTKPDKQPEESKSDKTVTAETKLSSSTTAAASTTERQSAGPPVARKGLPPTTSSLVKASPAIQAIQASVPGSANAAGVGAAGGPPSRPGTPLGRKALPPSVVVSSSLAKSSSSLGKDRSLAPSLASTSLSRQGSAVSANGTDVKGKGKASSPAPGGAPLSSREAERQRKRDKKKNKKRKLADLAATSGENGGSSMARSDSLGPPPNKQRRIEGSPGDVAGAAGGVAQGLKVKLNGFSLNRVGRSSPVRFYQKLKELDGYCSVCQSTTPGDGNTFVQPALPKKTVSAPGVADDFS